MIITSKVGFRGGVGADILLSINANINDYDIFAAADALSDPNNAAGGRKVVVTIANGVTIGSGSTATPAMKTGTGWGAGWTVDIVVTSGTARIQGRGGNGYKGQHRATLDFEGFCSNSPQGQEGGGGGGAGTSAGTGGALGGGNGSDTAGGIAGTAPTVGNCFTLGGATAATAGGSALEATSSGPNVLLKPSVGATLQVWGGGGGGGRRAAGGGPGLAGSGTSPGTNGKAYSTPGAATITETGPGTIDDRGL